MERFDRQKAINLMNEARKKDEELQKTLDDIYCEIADGARKGYGAVIYGPLKYSLATQVASFLEEKGFITVVCRAPGVCELEIIWEGY